MNYGMKISVEDKEVTDRDRDMVLTTKYPVSKIKSSETTSLTFTDTGVSDSEVIEHGLSYIPIFWVMGQYYEPDTDTLHEDYSRWPINFASSSFSIYYDYEMIYNDVGSLLVKAESFGGDNQEYTVNLAYVIIYEESG